MAFKCVDFGVRLSLVVLMCGMTAFSALGCGWLQERISQNTYKGHVAAAGSVVEEYYASHGRLPTSFRDAVMSSKRVRTPELDAMHYKVVGVDEYVVWLRREEIVGQYKIRSNTGPDDGDFYCHYRVGRVKIRASWD